MGKQVSIREYQLRKSKLATVRSDELESELEQRKFDKPFPLHIFHDKIKPFLSALHYHYDIPTSFIGLSMLSAYSTAIGTGYHIKINKLGKIYFPVWACLEGISSAGKSLIMNQVFEPHFLLQKEMEERFFNETEGMTREERIRVPIKQIIYGEANIPTLIKTIMPHNPKGILQDADEILAWVNGMNQLAKGGKEGTDEQFWMKCWNGRAHRKLLGDNQYFVIPVPFLNVFGGAQPSVMHKLFKNDRDTTGFIFRLLFAVPDKKKIAEPDYLYDMPEEFESIHKKSINSLYKGIPVYDALEDSSSMLIEPKALKKFMTWSSDKVKQINRMDDEMQMEVHAGIIGKIKEYTLRFAGLLHLADKSYDGLPFLQGDGELVSEETMERAIEAAEYFYDAAADISERVSKRIIATPEVLNMASLFHSGMSMQDIGILKWPALKSREAQRKRATRLIGKMIKEYPKIFNAKND